MSIEYKFWSNASKNKATERYSLVRQAFLLNSAVLSSSRQTNLILIEKRDKEGQVYYREMVSAQSHPTKPGGWAIQEITKQKAKREISERAGGTVHVHIEDTTIRSTTIIKKRFLKPGQEMTIRRIRFRGV